MKSGGVVHSIGTSISIFLLSGIFISPLEGVALLCPSDPRKDEALLYRQGQGLKVEILNAGTSFRVSFKNKILRQSFEDEVFFKKRSGGKDLNVQMQISERCGGVDLIFKLTNPTNISQKLPNFQIDGFIYGEPTKSSQVLGLKDVGNLVNLDPKYDQYGALDDLDLNSQIKKIIGGVYPFVYSPVVVASNGTDAIGSAFQYSYLDSPHTVSPGLKYIASGLQAGTWQHSYSSFSGEGYPLNDLEAAYLSPQMERTYTISLRFSKSRTWLMTLSSYKKSFERLYSAGRSDRKKNRSVIINRHLAEYNDYDSIENPRAYRTELKIHSEGWQRVVESTIEDALRFGITRTLLWNPSGLHRIEAFNFPPAFMSFDQVTKDTDFEFQKFKEAGIGLGFCWGRSTQIPYPLDGTWEPKYLVQADITNPDHLNFLSSQLALAVKRGAVDIRLDNFVHMKYSQQYIWAEEMRIQAPETTMSHEGSGSDFMHTRMANWSYPGPDNENAFPVNRPDLLSWYLNPQSEIQIFYPPGIDEARCKELTSWGFTPVANNGNIDFDVTACNSQPLSQCLDGLDNDKDGLTDFPFDPSCVSDLDAIE